MVATHSSPRSSKASDSILHTLDSKARNQVLSLSSNTSRGKFLRKMPSALMCAALLVLLKRSDVWSGRTVLELGRCVPPSLAITAI